VAVALFLGAGPALAVDWSSMRGGTGTKGNWEFGVYGGWSALDDYGGLRPESDVLFGGRLGYFVSRHLSIEGSAQRTPSSSRTTSQDFNINSYRGNAVMNLAVRNWFQPFVTAGGGYETTEAVTGNNQNTRTVNTSNFAWNVGAGARLFITPHVNVRAEGRFNQVTVDQIGGGPQGNGEGMLGFSWLFGPSQQEVSVVTPAMNMPPRVTCETDRSEVQPGQSVTIVANASDPEGGPVTYDWSSSAGRVLAAGRSATLMFDGTVPPSTVTVTVRATDDRGNTSTSECNVRVVEAARSAEEVSCLAGGFPRNLSRLTNVDKACLDDIVSRLRSDPRAHVVVIGYADTRETSPTRISAQRASAVKDYLANAGVDASRITTRSSGSSSLLDNGTDMAAQGRNRRVMVWFVPEGAKDPD